jgi:small-conductance mechanosensitive channel
MSIRIPVIAAGLLAVLLTATGRPGAEDFTDRLKKPIHESVAIRQKTQQERERWQTEKEKQVAAYEALEARRDALLAAREALGKDLDQQQARNRELADQLSKLEAISRDIEPFLEGIRASLAEHLRRDPALLPKERGARLQRLEKLLNDPSVDIAEKYRKTMEALFIEAEYGNTVDTYQQTILIAGQPVTVTILRLGRLALFYQSIDATTCGIYDRGSATWKPLAEKYNKAIRTALAIVRKQRPAQMVALPIGRLVAK